MKITNNPFILNYLFSGLNKRQEESKLKPKTDIEIMVEQNAKRIEDANLRCKIESIARKIAKGENVNPGDRALLAEHDPDLLRKANMVAKKGKDLEMRLGKNRRRNKNNNGRG